MDKARKKPEGTGNKSESYIGGRWAIKENLASLSKNIWYSFGGVAVSSYKEQGFKSIHKRWIIERTFAWLAYNWRLCPNYELIFDSVEEMVKIASSKLLLKKI
jgi:transposase